MAELLLFSIIMCCEAAKYCVIKHCKNSYNTEMSGWNEENELGLK